MLAKGGPGAAKPSLLGPQDWLSSLPRRAGSTLRAEPQGHRGRVGLPWKEAAVWVVSREALVQVVTCEHL